MVTKTLRALHLFFIGGPQGQATLRVRRATSDIQLTMNREYVLALAALLGYLIISAQAEPLQGSSGSKAVDNRSVPDATAAPVVTVPSGAMVSPSDSSVQKATKSHHNDSPDFSLPSGPKASDLFDAVRSPTNPDNRNVPLVIKLPTGAVVSPSGELIDVQNATNSTPVTTNNEPAAFPSLFFLSVTAIGALTGLVWWRTRKNKGHKQSIRRASGYHRYEGQVR
jgi:hypothetical protein